MGYQLAKTGDLGFGRFFAHITGSVLSDAKKCSATNAKVRINIAQVFNKCTQVLLRFGHCCTAKSCTET